MYENQWTAERVVLRLVEAFRTMRGAPMYSHRTGLLEPATFFEGPVDGIRLIQATSHYLGALSNERRALLTFARLKADGHPVRPHLRELGWSHSSFYRHRNAGSKAVAAAINRDRTPHLVAVG